MLFVCLVVNISLFVLCVKLFLDKLFFHVVIYRLCFFKEIQTAKEEFNERRSLKQSPIEHKPSRMSTSDKGTLVQCQVGKLCIFL